MRRSWRTELEGISFHSVNPDDLTNEMTNHPIPGDGRAANLAPDRGIMTMTVGGSPIKGGKDPTAGHHPPPPSPAAWTKEILANPPISSRLIGDTLDARPAWHGAESTVHWRAITLPRNKPDTVIE